MIPVDTSVEWPKPKIWGSPEFCYVVPKFLLKSLKSLE
jgi:hypothetical protein